MKKILFTVALCAFAASLFAAPAKTAAAPANEKVILAGPLSPVVPKKAPKGLTTKEWVKYWGLAGTAGYEKGVINMKSGIMYGFHVQYTTKAEKLTLIIKASALAGAKNGKLNGYFSTCVRKPGEKKPFRHEKRTYFGPFNLTAEAKEYKVEYNITPYEQGYIYIGETNLSISSIRVVTTPAK